MIVDDVIGGYVRKMGCKVKFKYESKFVGYIDGGERFFRIEVFKVRVRVRLYCV